MGRVLLIGAVAIVVAIIGAAATFGWLVFRDDRLPVVAAHVDVAQGASANAIGHQLEEQGVIADATLLAAYFRIWGGGDRIEAAEYDVPSHRTIAQVAAILEAGGHPPFVWITFPEGFTASQMGQRLAAAGIVPAAAFAQAVRDRFLVLGGVATRGLEGYLFPDTYQIPRGAGADAVASIMTQQFQRELPAGAIAAARHLGYSLPQIVIVASMIEREAKVDRDRPLIASVIYNRLRLGMPLEIDATIEYALPQHKTELSFADLALDSPYNTYKHTGLPPTPISNPGKASLLAALHPASTPYLYYVYKGDGEHEFSTTLEQQQANERRYLR